MNYIKDNLVVFFAGIITIIMLVIGIFYGYFHNTSEDGIAEIGAFLAGIFAPIIWIWFLASYAVQSSELKLQRQALAKQTEELSLNREELSLQRQELTLQRQAIEQSTLAQQGSELALHEQSKALQAQLKISSQQYEYAIQQRIQNKPKFILPKITLNSLMESNRTRPGFFRCAISIINIGSDAKIRVIEVYSPYGHVQTQLSEDQNTIKIYSSIDLNKLTRQKLTEDKVPSDERQANFDIYRLIVFRDILLSCELHIFYYSDKTGAGSDKYIIKIIENIVNISVKPTLTLPSVKLGF